MGTIDSIVKGAEFLRKADKIEEYKQILELLEERPKFLEQISELKEENRVLKDKLKNIEEFKLGTDCYIDKEGVRYCMRCFDKNKDTIRLKSRGNGLSMECPECKNLFDVSGSRSQAPVFIPKYHNYN